MRVIPVLALVSAMFILYSVFFEPPNGGSFPDWMWWLSKAGKLVIVWLIVRGAIQLWRKPAKGTPGSSAQSS